MWYYTLNGQSVGPISEATLRELLSSGTLGPATFVWREGMEQWIPASQFGAPPPVPAVVPARAPGYFYQQGPTDGTMGGLIPTKNPVALTGYYVSVGSLVPCLGFFLGPVAFGLGCKGLSDAKKNPAIKGAAHAWVAIVLGGLTSLFNWGAVFLMIVNGGFS